MRTIAARGPGTNGTSSAKRVPRDERRAIVMRAAGPLFARHGYAGTRLQDVAAAAHVSKPILYRHFDSKKALYLALLAKHEEDLPSFMEQAVDAARDLPPDEILRTILDRWLDYVRENGHTWEMLFRDGSGDDEIRAFRRQVSVRAREVLAAYVASRPDSRVPAEQVEPTAELLRAGLVGLVLWWIDHPDTPKSQIAEIVMRMDDLLSA